MKKAVWLAVMVLAVAASGCLRTAIVKKQYEKSPPLPVVEGRLEVPGLEGPVEVYRDRYGVPHIFTENEPDLFFAIGYVQAQDRLWEMVFLRAVATGRLSELFGEIGVPGGREVHGFVLSTTGMDRRQRVLGMKWLGEVAEALLEKTDPGLYRQLQAYCNGVNTFISTHSEWEQLPLEFQVLRVKPEPFRIADLMSFNVFIGSMLCGNLERELLRYGLFKKYGPDLGWKFAPLHDAPGPTIVPHTMLKNKLSLPRELPPGGRPSERELGGTIDNLAAEAAFQLLAAETAIKRAFYIEYPYASNNWIIGPKLSATGRAMLCNDPHLTHLQPSLFYMMHIKGAGIDCMGVTFPGNPFLVLAHTRRLAWGATTTTADVQDLYIETVSDEHPGKYFYKGEWRPFTVREEVIRIRVPGGFREKKIRIRQSIHGPIINDIVSGLPKDTPPLALRWTAWDFNRDVSRFEALVTSATLEELFSKLDLEELKRAEVMSAAHMFNELMRGVSIEDFKRGVDKLVVPNQSWVAADADGHIAYIPGGLVPVRKKGIGVMPVPGESGEFDWVGFIPTTELPLAIDPERGYMATANNEVVDAEWYPYIFATDYGEGWRAWRIEELINQLAPLDMDDLRRIQNDVRIKEAEWLVPKVLAAVERKKPTDPLMRRAADELRAWDYEADLDATAPVLFYTLTRQIRRNILEDEMPRQDYKTYLSNAAKVVTMWIDRGESEFFDDKRTAEVEELDDIFLCSLRDAMAKVERKYGRDPAARQWGKLHTLKWYHPLGWGLLSPLSVGPYPHLGGNQTVRNASMAGFGKNPWKCLGGPVLRHIIDLGDPDHALMIIDGSQSGQWLSPHYDDLHPLFINSEYISVDMRPEVVKQTAPHLLVLTPE